MGWILDSNRYVFYRVCYGWSSAMNPPNEVKKEGAFVAVEGGPFLTVKEVETDGNLVVDPEEMKKYEKALLKSDREGIRSGIEALIEKVAMTPHFPGGAIERMKGYQLEILDEVLKLISDKE